MHFHQRLESNPLKMKRKIPPIAGGQMPAGHRFQSIKMKLTRSCG